MRVTILTVGEYPTANGLHASQVLPFASYLHGNGVPVRWIAFAPVEMRVRDLVQNRGALLAAMHESVSCSGIHFQVCLFPITIVRLYSYIFRSTLVRLAGKKLVSLLRANQNDDEFHVIHCRSYFAAAVALEYKKSNRNTVVSFDMRSLLPPEIPLMFPRIGPILYGSLKNWEATLLNEVDYSFLPSRRGIRLLESEGHKRPPQHINIVGFDSGDELLHENSCPIEKIIGYVGGFGPWQSTSVLEKVFGELARHVADCSFDVITAQQVSFSGKVSVRSLSHLEVRSAIQRMMAVVVPGVETTADHFSSLVNSYLFSTKASEALSVGIPLIVNAQLCELADFVRSQGCGLVFSINEGRVEFEQTFAGDQFNDQEVWQKMRTAARACAQDFMRSNVYARYCGAWERR